MKPIKDINIFSSVDSYFLYIEVIPDLLGPDEKIPDESASEYLKASNDRDLTATPYATKDDYWNGYNASSPKAFFNK